MEHIGIFLSNKANKNKIIEEIEGNRFLRFKVDLSSLSGAIFSDVTIHQLMDEEFKHDTIKVTLNGHQGLLSMSSGQRRKALLSYIIVQKPGYVILDDIYGSLDDDTRQYIQDQLLVLSSSSLIIQLFYRRQDILSCIQTVIIEDGKEGPLRQMSVAEFLGNTDVLHLQQHITLPNLFTHYGITIHPIIELRSVSAAYGEKPVLKDISWKIESGEFWQLKGANGSGKSTLISLITGDNPRGYGLDMILFGRKKGTGETIWDIKKYIGYFTPNMIQRFSHEDSVENMIISGLVDSVGLYTKPTDLQRDIARDWLQVLGTAFNNKSFSSLTAGQQRILMVVRAMVKHPPLLILDEPTVGLDDENTQLFVQLIQAIASQRKVAIIYVSHRNEPELKPDRIYELLPTESGSVGRIIV